ncbi:MAG: HD domain-containing protein [Clostridiales bacterium]|nr:HD domain-containing protein [Clostridiales bacterium]
MKNFVFNKSALHALDMLNCAGFEAYIVGGAVRDNLLSKIPHDCDIATSALPDETLSVFSEYKTVTVGIRHGTVGVVIDGDTVEITTYRIDSQASRDHRHPQSITFSRSLSDDLVRRDFTINALVYSPKTGITDLVGGIEDCRNRIIRAIGEPEQRFKEDALRILRCIRFSSVLGFDIEENTKKALFTQKKLLQGISVERIYSELTKTLCGISAGSAIMDYIDIWAEAIPELAALKNEPQNNPHHLYDVLKHTAISIESISPRPDLRLTMLLHDISKGECRTIGEDGFDHFKGHQEKSAKAAEKILTRLHAEGSTVKSVCTLIEYHDYRPSASSENVKRLLNKIGERAFFDLMEVKLADDMAHSPDTSSQAYILKLKEMADKIIAQGECYSLKQLKICGGDLIDMGIKPDAHISHILLKLLDDVINERCPNDASALKKLAFEYIKNKR